MAEIKTIPKRSRPQNRPPLRDSIPEGADLYERLDLPRYVPPRPKEQKPVKEQSRPSASDRQPPRLHASEQPPEKREPGPLRSMANNGITPPAARPLPFKFQDVDTETAQPPDDRTPGTRPLEQQPAQRQEAEPPAPSMPAVPAQKPLQPRPFHVEPARRLSQLLAESEGLPQQTAVLGICEDRLPMLLDLNDPSPGALLVVGDERQLQLDLLRTAISSVVMRNSPRGVQFIVFSHLPDAWSDWVKEQGFDRYCLGVLGVDTPASRDWIGQLAGWVEERRMGVRAGPPVLMLMDTLNFIPKLSYDLRLGFELLVKEGPQAGIWPVAAISTALANSLSRHIQIFQTLLFGFTEDAGFYEKMAGLKDVEARNFLVPGMFAVKVGYEGEEDWMKFRLPAPG